MTIESPQVAAIRERYQTSLPEKARMIELHQSKLIDSNKNLDRSFQELRSDLHKLAGSSGMYGYEDISILSRSAMQLIDYPEAGGVDLDLMSATLSHLVDIIQQHAEPC